MLPSIWDGDLIELEAVDPGSVRIGDVVLICRDNGACVLHRVVRVSAAGVFVRGDAQRYSEGPFPLSALTGRVTAVRHRTRLIRTNSLVCRALVSLWIRTAPLGAIALDALLSCKRAARRVFSLCAS